MARRQANLWANYRNPKELDEDLTEREQAFVEALIDKKLEPEGLATPIILTSAALVLSCCSVTSGDILRSVYNPVFLKLLL
jgi:hypothetical protein